MPRVRRRARLAVVALLGALLIGCTPGPSGAGVVVLFPGGPDDAWGASAEVLRGELAREGRSITVRFAGDDIPTQLRQLQEALAAEPAAVVVAPVDTTALAAELVEHDELQTTLISYERLVLDTPEIDVVAGFDHRQAGRLQARALLAALGLSDAAPAPGPPRAVELLAGSGDDPAARASHEGALEVLRPHLDSGALAVPSERVEFEQAAILRGDAGVAAGRVAELLAEGVELAAVLAPSDAMSTAVAEAIVAHGSRIALPLGAAAPDAEPAADPEAESEPPPAVVLVGGGTTHAGLEAVRDGTRTATVYRDPQRLARAVANMVREILRGSAPTVTRGALSDNGAAEIPTRLVEPLLVATQERARTLLP